MNTYLVDEAVLEQFADAFIKEKYPNDSAKDHSDLKKGLVKDLDRQILKAVVGSLTPEQGNELNTILKNNGSDPVAFENFFKERNIDLEKIVTDAIVGFRKDFMNGGKNE